MTEIRDVLLTAYFGRPDDNVLESSLNSFRHWNETAEIWVFNSLNDGHDNSLFDKYKATGIHSYTDDELEIVGRSAAKMAIVHDILESTDPYMGRVDRVIVADADLYYLTNPFELYDENPFFSLAVTTRHYPFFCPVNGGLFALNTHFFRKELADLFAQCKFEIMSEGVSWDKYEVIKSLRNVRNLKKESGDWWLDQDFLTAVLINKHFIEKEAFEHLIIHDLGAFWNYCPDPHIHEGGYEGAVKSLRKAKENELAAVLHLKGNLKKIIYSDAEWLEDAVNYREMKSTDWSKNPWETEQLY